MATRNTTDAGKAEPILELRGISKSYADASGKPTPVLANLDLSVAEGEFVAILGFSGTGKTTLVSTIAGLLEPDWGEVLIKGQKTTKPGPDRGVVFQSYSLMPWLTVEGNVRLAVDSVHKALGKAERDEMTADTIELVGLTHAADRKLAQLSGGMRQRVAVARALAGKPEILLMDEPLSALDALTRAKLQDEIERIRSQEKRTIVLVTNDVDEALLLADRVAILSRGPGAKIDRMFDVQLARPRERTELSTDLLYTSLRNEIVSHLDAMNTETPAIDLGAVPHLDQHILQIPTGEAVEHAEWFVEQKQFGAECKRSGQADPLLHSVRELAGRLVHCIAQTDPFQVVLDDFAALGFAGLGVHPLDTERHVVAGSEPRKQ